ncbi:MAG TPA: TIGR04222 domain-containing membrane protein [Croceibacterium sp.]
MIGVNPFDWDSDTFLVLYALLFAGAFAVSFAIAAWLRPQGRAVPVADEDELALLAGGRTRLGETVLARLFARRAITVGRNGIHLHSTVAGASVAERDVLALPSPFKWKAVDLVLAGASALLEQRLVDRGLMTDPRGARQLGAYAAFPFMLLLVLGLARLVVGIARDEAIGLLVAFMVASAIVAAYRLFVTDRRTSAGIGTVSDARQRSERLRRAPTQAEIGTAVALFGTAVLIGSPLADLHGIQRDKGDGGSGCGGGGSSCGSDGGSGCGGGGCGGCGG